MKPFARAFFSHMVRDRQGRIKQKVCNVGNLRTNTGIDWQASVMGNISSQPAAGGWLALSSSQTTPQTTDTVLDQEITTNGMQRAQASYAHTVGTTFYVLSNTFTATGPNVINKTAVFNAASDGTMIFESANPSPPIVVAGDTDTQTTTVNI